MALVTRALDTFTDTDRNLGDHTPNLGFGGWTYSGAANEWVIFSNRAVKSSDVGVTHFCRSDSDVADDNFEAFLDYTRSEGTDYSGERGGLYLLGHKTNNIALGEGVMVEFKRQTSATMQLEILRRDSVGTIVQQVVVVTDLPISSAFGDSLRIGAVVSGLEVQAYTEPAGGGTRTNYSAVTLTADLRDGNHKRAGLTSNSVVNNPAFAPKQDNLTVQIENSPPSTPGTFSAPLLENVYRDELIAAWGASTDPEGDTLQYEGQYSDDAGVSWLSLFSLQSGLSYTWDISSITEGTQYQVRVRAHDGTDYSAAYKESDVFYISAPQCEAGTPDLSGGCTA